MTVTEMSVWADRQVHLGTGANIKIGGSVKFNVAEGDNPSALFEATQIKVLSIVNRLADQIEDNIEMPANWPGAKGA